MKFFSIVALLTAGLAAALPLAVEQDSTPASLEARQRLSSGVTINPAQQDTSGLVVGGPVSEPLTMLAYSF
ncbi:hypothetical protein OPT61_g10050 [Boeremia exigua]|uniref:Uncharacterized protein n=1 Tax=Boeremia exigua TaxID=749465 RepID=A0ACC2HSZ9_9PLEO|nr:hypothetical protein OPT61_g10050 [Boeremia exigua]